jgi:hypothetical protein
VLANGGKTTAVKMGVLPRTEMFCNLLCNNSFGAVRGRTKENFSRKFWLLFGENPYLCANKHRGRAVCNRPADERQTTKVVQAPRTLQTEGLNFCNMMTEKDFNEIAEDFGILQSTRDKLQCVCEILEIYPNTKCMSLFGVRQMLREKELEYTMKIKNHNFQP